MRVLPFLVCAALVAQPSEDPVRPERIAGWVRIVLSGDRSRVAALIHYPLPMRYPVKAIETPKEFLARYDEVFDDALLERIRRSDARRDWTRVGWRGIMLGNGSLWLDDDYRIIAVNHETARAKAVRAALVLRQKQALPEDLRTFDEPVLDWSTGRHRIRVDRTGGDYRLVVFDGGRPPRVLLSRSGGRLRYEGTLGDFQIDWQAGGRTYRIRSGGDPLEDCYYVYDRPVGPEEWPDDPVETEPRKAP